jgi:leucyl-tRNA synthetase
LNAEALNYVFLQGEYSEKITIPEDKLKMMKGEFEYWYPMDLRVSAKDLI